MSKIIRTSTVDAVVNLLTERIHRRIYVPGSKLPSERKLQDEFGIGRLALREALSRMNAMGIIETSHGKGTFVQDNLKSQTLKNILIPYFALEDSKRLKEFADARAMIESEIAGLAALQRSSTNIAKLETILDQEFDHSTSDDQVAGLDLQFHQELVIIVDNRFLRLMHEALVSHIEAFLNEFVKSKTNPREVMDAHRPILDAVRRGDAEDARNLMRLHVSYSMQDYENFMKQKRLSDSTGVRHPQERR